jgi:hypothetical protein
MCVLSFLAGVATAFVLSAVITAVLFSRTAN